MIDIIIPITNKCPNLKQTLLSLLLQSIKDNLNIIILSTKQQKKHKELIDLFSSKLKITYIVDNNKTLDELKNYSLSITNNEYIIFIDENTYLYDAFSINNLYSQLINDNTEFIIGNTVNLENNNYINTFSIYDNSNNKIYKKEYLNKHNINYENDLLFTIKTYLYSTIYSYSDSITSVNINNKEILDKKIIKNIIETIKQLPSPIDKNSIKEFINRITKNTTEKWLNSNTQYSNILKELEKLYDEYN